jgi:hypothetical protein
MLTRQRVIMHHTLLAAPDHSGTLEQFAEVLDDPGHARSITISIADYLDLGSPSVITVTIDPGDLLNEP